jgi:hypothetical protein
MYKCTLVKYGRITAAVAATSTAVLAVRKISPILNPVPCIQLTAISIKVVPEQSGKVEYERERLAGNR